MGMDNLNMERVKPKEGKMGRKWLLAVGVCVGLVLLLAGTGQAQSKAGEAKTLRIGSLKALTGFYSFYDGADAMDVKYPGQHNQQERWHRDQGPEIQY